MQSSPNEVHRLRMALLACHKRTGEMLHKLKSIAVDRFDVLLSLEQISHEDAELYMTLHEQWELVVAALSEADESPTTAQEALDLLATWKQHHLH
jgi:hypothetical protein